jgi:hypothetical protein
MTVLWRYARAQASWQWLMQPFVVAVMFLWALLNHRVPETRTLANLYGLCEYFLPLAAALYLGGLPAWEREEGTAETHLTYPQWPSVRLLLAGASRAGAWLLMAGAALGAVQLWYLKDVTLTLAKAVAAPAFALAGAAAAGTAVTRSQAGGFTLAGLWWFFDAVSLGHIKHPFYLFRLSTPPLGLDPAVATRNLWLLGAALWLLALALAHRRERWVR